MKTRVVSKMIDVGELTADLVVKNLENDSEIEEVRINIETGQEDLNGIDIHWDVEIDHPDDYDLERQAAFEIMSAAGTAIDTAETTLKGLKTPHLDIFVRVYRVEGKWESSVKSGFLKGWSLKLIRFLRSLFQRK